MSRGALLLWPAMFLGGVLKTVPEQLQPIVWQMRLLRKMWRRQLQISSEKGCPIFRILFNSR